MTTETFIRFRNGNAAHVGRFAGSRSRVAQQVGNLALQPGEVAVCWPAGEPSFEVDASGSIV